MEIMAKGKTTSRNTSTKSDKRMAPPGGYNGNRRRYGTGGKCK